MCVTLNGEIDFVYGTTDAKGSHQCLTKLIKFNIDIAPQKYIVDNMMVFLRADELIKKKVFE